MTPHNQLFMHNPAIGVWGDCFRTCIACLLDLPLEEVPHEHGDFSSEEQDAKMNAWLAGRGLRLIRTAVRWPDSTMAEFCTWAAYMNSGPYMLSGLSPSGTSHVVICDETGMLHDPHPRGTGLAGPYETGSWWVSFIGKLV